MAVVAGSLVAGVRAVVYLAVELFPTRRLTGEVDTAFDHPGLSTAGAGAGDGGSAGGTGARVAQINTVVGTPLGTQGTSAHLGSTDMTDCEYD